MPASVEGDRRGPRRRVGPGVGARRPPRHPCGLLLPPVTSPLTVPVDLRVHLAHATLQAIAEASGTHLLHIKGPATDSSLRDPGKRGSVDADVLIQPGHLKRFAAALRANGWTEVLPVRSGAVLDHSTNWYHPELGQADIHLRFPGIQIRPEDAFQVLWAGRGEAKIAHRVCSVPSLTGQRLVLLLHAARTPQGRAGALERCWTQAGADERDALVGLVRTLDAEVAFAAATGNLEEFADRREYTLWRMFADDTSTLFGLRKVRAEMAAAPAGSANVPVAGVWKVLLVVARMPTRVSTQTGQRATLAEVVGGYWQLVRRGMNDLSSRFGPRRPRG